MIEPSPRADDGPVLECDVIPTSSSAYLAFTFSPARRSFAFSLAYLVSPSLSTCLVSASLPTRTVFPLPQFALLPLPPELVLFPLPVLLAVPLLFPQLISLACNLVRLRETFHSPGIQPEVLSRALRARLQDLECPKLRCDEA